MQQLDSSMFPGFPGYEDETPSRSSIKSKGGSDYSDWPGFEEDQPSTSTSRRKNYDEMLREIERRIDLGLPVDARDVDELVAVGLFELPKDYRKEGNEYVSRKTSAMGSLGYQPSMTPSGEMVYGSGMGGALTGEDTRRFLAMQPTGPTAEQVSLVEGARGRIASRMREQDMEAAERANLELERMRNLRDYTSQAKSVDQDLDSIQATRRRLLREANKLLDQAAKEKNPAEKRRLIQAAAQIQNQITNAENTESRLKVSKDNLELRKNADNLKTKGNADQAAVIDEVVAWIEANRETNPEAAAEAAKIIKDGNVKNLSVEAVISSAQAITAGGIAEAARKAADINSARIAAEQRAEARAGRQATAADIREIEQDIAELEGQIAAAGGSVVDGRVMSYPNNPELASAMQGAERTLGGLYSRLQAAQGQVSAAAPTGLSAEEQAAYDWAMANPNDPRSAQILQALGL